MRSCELHYDIHDEKTTDLSVKNNFSLFSTERNKQSVNDEKENFKEQ